MSKLKINHSTLYKDSDCGFIEAPINSLIITPFELLIFKGLGKDLASNFKLINEYDLNFDYENQEFGKAIVPYGSLIIPPYELVVYNQKLEINLNSELKKIQKAYYTNSVSNLEVPINSKSISISRIEKITLFERNLDSISSEEESNSGNIDKEENILDKFNIIPLDRLNQSDSDLGKSIEQKEEQHVLDKFNMIPLDELNSKKTESVSKALKGSPTTSDDFVLGTSPKMKDFPVIIKIKNKTMDVIKDVEVFNFDYKNQENLEYNVAHNTIKYDKILRDIASISDAKEKIFRIRCQFINYSEHYYKTFNKDIITEENIENFWKENYKSNFLEIKYSNSRGIQYIVPYELDDYRKDQLLQDIVDIDMSKSQSLEFNQDLNIYLTKLLPETEVVLYLFLEEFKKEETQPVKEKQVNSEYKKLLEEIRKSQLTQFYIGQEVITEDGKGIIISINTLDDNDTLNPEQGLITVWFDSNYFLTYKISDLMPHPLIPNTKIPTN